MKYTYAIKLDERLLSFSVDVILYLRTIKHSGETMDMKRQLTKSSTSAGANYEESRGAYTRPDTRMKIGISLKEMRESNYFLRIFERLDLGKISKCGALVKESTELKLMLASILNKLNTILTLVLGTWHLNLGISIFTSC